MYYAIVSRIRLEWMCQEERTDYKSTFRKIMRSLLNMGPGVSSEEEQNEKFCWMIGSDG